MTFIAIEEVPSKIRAKMLTLRVATRPLCVGNLRISKTPVPVVDNPDKQNGALEIKKSLAMPLPAFFTYLFISSQL